MENEKPSQTTITQLVETGKAESANARSTRRGPTPGESAGNVALDHSGVVKSNTERESSGAERKKVEIHDRLLAENMLVPDTNLGPEIQDDYRRIKRPLLSNAVGRDRSMVDRGNLILVTSAIPGEGKTYTSVNLALSMSQEMDNTVLLVDCDVAKKGVSRMLGLENETGLVDVLERDDLTIGDVLLQTDIPNLRLVSAGKQNKYVTELLASDRMYDLVNEIASRYSNRIIIFDGPPLLPAPQTQILAGLVGQVVFVVEAGKTQQSLVEEALEMIPENQATGLVMNKNEGLSSRGSHYYGYYGQVDDEK